MSFTLNTCPQHPRQLKLNRKVFHLKHQIFCPTKRGHLFEAAGVQISRAQALLDAIDQHGDFSLISICKIEVEEHGRVEILVVDLVLDEVPPKNKYGI